MTPLFPAQRAAEEFDSVLDGRATQAVADRYAELIATVEVLRDQPEVTPRAEFVADLRSRLMLAAETELVAAPPVVRRERTAGQRSRRFGTAAAALVIVGGTAGMAAAASGALPGESLYPIKLGTEQVSTALHFGDAAKGTAMLGDANNRLDEVAAMLATGNADPGLVTSTVDAFTSSAGGGADKLFRSYQAGGDSADIATVRTFTSTQMAKIATMAATADPTTQGDLRDAADTLTDIDQQARTLCSACGHGDRAVTPPASLSNAAAAASVDNLIARPVSQASADEAVVRAARAAAASKAIANLQDAAQKSATKMAETVAGGAGIGVLGTGPSETPLSTTITESGGVVPAPVATAGAAVKDLVSGVTDSVAAATKSLTAGPGGTSTGLPDLKGTLQGTTDGLGKGVGTTLDGTTKGLLP